LQREIRSDWLLSVGYVGTKGSALFQTIDLNPTVPGSQGRLRVQPGAGVRTTRCNCTSSSYHSLQVSGEKRLSSGLALAAHYTWSSFIDGASDIGAVSLGGELPVAQDSFNRRADRGRSAYDRPHRVAANGVFELPFWRMQRGLAGKLMGGWQASAFLVLQSGAPFTVLDGSDPGFRLSGVAGAATVRANVNTTLDLAGLRVEEILRHGGSRLFSRVSSAAPLGNIGRNILRSDGLANLDLGLIKNTVLREKQKLQLRVELYNFSNTRNFGVPSGIVSNPGFLNQWAGDGGNRRILLAARYVF
jgi:hypothetical protein